MKRNKFYIAVLMFSLFSCGEKKEKIRLPFYNTPDFTPQWTSEIKNNASIHTIAAFSFIDQNGKQVTNKNVEGKIYVANFFFTTCGSICPKMMNNLKKVHTAFPNGDVLILSHSVLPGTDSVSRLKKYESRMAIDGTRWWLLTGDKDAIYKMARQSYFADEEIGYAKGSDEFLHTENCVLIDGKGRIRGVYNATLELEINKLIEHIRILQQE
jgi:protein SCO1/2